MCVIKRKLMCNKEEINDDDDDTSSSSDSDASFFFFFALEGPFFAGGFTCFAV